METKSGMDRSVPYFVDHESATEDDFMSAINKHGEKTEAIWYDFTDINIETIIIYTSKR